MKLTKAQRLFLSLILTNTMNELSRTSDALEARGLIFWQPNRRTGGSWFITDAGRAALESQQ